MKKSATKRGMGPQREDVTAIEDLSLYNRQLSPQPKGHLFIGSRSVQSFLYMLILLYLSLSLLSVASDADYNVFSMCIYSSQLCILAVFMVEQSLKINFFGWRYVKNAWNWLDLIVIFICFLLVIAEFNQFHVSVFKYFQFICILRLLRMVSLYRKLTETKTLLEKKKHSIVVTTASQEVVDILQHIRRSMNNTEIDEKLKWCIQIISENKLHDPKFPIIHPSSHLHAEELLPWIQSFSKEPSRRRSTELMQAPAIQEFSISPESIVLIPEEVNDSLENISSFEFDVFSLQSACSGNELLTLMVFFFTKSHLLGFFPAAQFREWVTAVQEGYKKTNPYHNSTHAADVTQTIHSVLFGCDAAHIFSLHLLDVACCYLAACIHDFQHPGLNNKFLISTRHQLAVLYNDKSVLENHHIAASFALTEDEEKAVFIRLKPDEFTYLRAKIIGMVLATDMSRHFCDLSKFLSRLEARKEEANDEDKGLRMEMMLHCCDISNPSKPWKLCKVWAERILQEFFAQGDQEKELGLPVSDLCDRETTVLGTSQVGFIDFIVTPSFSALSHLLPELDSALKRLQENKERWKSFVDTK